MSSPKPARVVKAAGLPRRLPFLGVAVKRNGKTLEVYIKTAPGRRWKLMLVGLLTDLPTHLPTWLLAALADALAPGLFL